MIVCMCPECQTAAGGKCRTFYPAIGPIPSPRTMPVSLPFSSFGVTIAIMDSDGNLTIKVDQPTPDRIST